MRGTVFKSIGIGYALSNLGIKEREIEVFLPEQSFLRTGEVLPTGKYLNYNVQDINNLQRQGKITTANTIPATWLPFTTNHVVAPSIRRGERVEVYRMGDGEEYYWRPLGLDDDLRRGDTILIAISNTKDESTTALTAENTYWLEFSSQSKKVALVTTTSDGEPFGWQLTLDTSTSELQFTDEIGDLFEIITKDKILRMVSGDGAYAKIEKNTVELATPEGANYYINGNDITSKNASGSTMTMVDDAITLTSSRGGSLVITDSVVAKSAAGDTLELASGTSSLKASSGGALVISTGKISGT